MRYAFIHGRSFRCCPGSVTSSSTKKPGKRCQFNDMPIGIVGINAFEVNAVHHGSHPLLLSGFKNFSLSLSRGPDTWAGESCWRGRWTTARGRHGQTGQRQQYPVVVNSPTGEIAPGLFEIFLHRDAVDVELFAGRIKFLASDADGVGRELRIRIISANLASQISHCSPRRSSPWMR